MNGGTFNVSRAIWDHPAFRSEKYSEREAFLWLISEASWKPRSRRVGNFEADLDRGQLCASVRFLAEIWGWSKSKTSRYILRLKNRDMIDTESGTGILVITICNYDEYQGQPNESGTRAGQQPGHERDSGGTVAGQYRIRGKEGGKKENIKPTPKTELSSVLSEETAAAVIEHRQRIKSPLTAHAAKLLAGEFSKCADPELAASEMMRNGWRGFKAGWVSSEKGKSDDRFARKMEMARGLDRRSEANGGMADGASGGASVAVLPSRRVGGH